MAKRALAAAVALAVLPAAFAQPAPVGELVDVLPVPWHSPELYSPDTVIRFDPAHGHGDSSVIPGSARADGQMGPIPAAPGQFIILNRPQAPRHAPPPGAPAPAAPESLNYLRPQQLLPQYRLEQDNPAHAAIQQAVSSRDEAGAMRAAQEASARGDIAATRFVASRYQTGMPTYNLRHWLHWMDRAAQQGDFGAQYELGRLYAAGLPAEATKTGQPLAADLHAAIRYLQMCAGASNDCAYELGVVGLQTGAPSSAAAIQRVAGLAHPKAMLWLGRALVEGAHGQPRDPVMGAVWLKLASLSGLQEAGKLYDEVYSKLADHQRKSVDVSVQQLQDRFKQGGVVRRRHAKKNEPEGLLATIVEAAFQNKVAKPLSQRLGSPASAP